MNLRLVRMLQWLLAPVIVLNACTSVAPARERWAVRVVAPDGRFVGSLILEITSQPSSRSCLSQPDTVFARIVERNGFAEHRVRDEAAVHRKDGDLYADLTVGTCDDNLTLHGTVTGTRASGEVLRGGLFGVTKVGTFVAEKR